jgi:hypothetical protein
MLLLSRQRFGGCAHPAESLLAEMVRGRQNRVVLTPVAGVKSAEVLIGPTGREKPSIRR